MDAFSPIYAYVFGTASVGLGVHAFFWPRREYARFGLPLEPSGPSSSTNTSPTAKALTGGDGSASPLMYLKGIRETSYGLALIALQYQDSGVGVTTVAGVLSLAALGDGLVVWLHGRGRARQKAWGHWGAAVGLGSWAAWRAFVAYGEWAAFHAQML